MLICRLKEENCYIILTLRELLLWLVSWKQSIVFRRKSDDHISLIGGCTIFTMRYILSTKNHIIHWASYTSSLPPLTSSLHMARQAFSVSWQVVWIQYMHMISEQHAHYCIADCSLIPAAKTMYGGVAVATTPCIGVVYYDFWIHVYVYFGRKAGKIRGKKPLMLSEIALILHLYIHVCCCLF